MGWWDLLVDNVIEPVGSLIIEGVEATGRGIDTVVTTGIDVIGGGVDKAVEAVKENPLEAVAAVGSVLSLGPTGLVVKTAKTVASGISGASDTGVSSSTIPSEQGSTFRNVASTAAKICTPPAAPSLSGFVLKGLADSVIDNHVRKRVKPVMGSILYCDLALVVEHSGIYVGNGKIAHLDGSGKIEIVTARQFLKRLGGLNPASSIYVSCNEETAVGSSRIGHLARAMAGGERSYNVILDNCHQFASGCITGNFDNADNFLWMLKHTAENELNTNNWRVWDISS